MARPAPRRPTIERINASPAVVSVDMPSGVDASSGEIAGAVVAADLTVTFHAAKVGLIVAPGRFKAGVDVAGIGLEDAPTEIVRATPATSSTPCPRRGEARHEVQAPGAVVVVGGWTRDDRGRLASARWRPCARMPDT